MDSAALFKAMADGTRQRTLGVLRRAELNVTELVTVLDQPQSTISRHLKILRDAGLIWDRRDGNTMFYSALGSGDQELTSWLLRWSGDQPLARAIDSRLEAVLYERREMSHSFFNRMGRRWDTLRQESFGTSFHLEALLALLPQEWTVADVGTGTGYLLPVLARHFARVVGIEPVESMLETAVQRVDHHALGNVVLSRGDLAKLPMESASVDLAIAVLVIHHVSAPPDALAELYRVVRSGGHVLIVEQTAHKNGGFRDKMQDRWWGFKPQELGQWVEAVGFQAVRSRMLATVERGEHAPDLFVLTGKKHACREIDI